MGNIPPIIDPTLEAIDAALVEREEAAHPRPYLGMSSIGEPCERRLWLTFRWVSKQSWKASTLRMFEDGHRCESLMAERLRMVKGVELRTVDPRTGRQFGFADLGGHFRGHADGMILGILQAPTTWHVWEHKASERGPELVQAKAKEGEKDALAKWSPTYYAQAVLYMHYSGLTRHYLTCDSPGGRSTVSVRTNADPAFAWKLIEKARRIITDPEPPQGVSKDPAWYQCRSCPVSAACHRGEALQVNCRTCVHATPELEGDGRWSCARWGADIPDVEAQRAGCPEHRLIPALLTWAQQVDASADENWIEYEVDGLRFRNGADGLTSAELAHGKYVPAFAADPIVAKLRAQGATIVEAGPAPESSPLVAPRMPYRGKGRAA